MRSYPGKLYHKPPHWVEDGAFFHIRIRRAHDAEMSLISPALGRALLDAALFYHRQHRWYSKIFLLMPDHLHAVLAFPREPGMSRVISDWKRYHATTNAVPWQDNYFDHRLRNAEEVVRKIGYIRQNPVVKGLCEREEDWPWVVEPEKMDWESRRYSGPNI